MCVIALHVCSALNLNPLTPFHQTEKAKELKKSNGDDNGEEKGGLNEEKSKKEGISISRKGLQKKEKIADDSEDPVEEKEKVSSSLEKRNNGKKKSISLFSQGDDEDDKPFVQPEHHISSNKKCQSKEDKGCCEGFIDLVIDW